MGQLLGGLYLVIRGRTYDTRAAKRDSRDLAVAVGKQPVFFFS
jgi:hypothetical protein